MDGIEDAMFTIPRQIVADISVIGIEPGEEGSVLVALEALTIAE